MPDKILIADDEQDILNLTKIALEQEGYQVVCVTSGEEALRLADAELPDLILLDVMMYGKTGFEICKILKTQAKTKHIPVVMVTILGRDVDRKLSNEAGADGHFVKPFTPTDLTAEVKKILEKARTGKFSKQFGIEHDKLMGKKILFEFDPATPYARLVRDFVLESVALSEAVVVMTRKVGPVRQAVEGDRGIELVDLQTDPMLSSILQKYSKGPLNIVYGNLTDLTLSTDSQTAYRFVQKSIELLAERRITGLFLFNSAAHDQKYVSSIRGLFSSQIGYGKEGATITRI